MPHHPSDVQPLGRVSHELRTIADLVEKIAGSEPQPGARDHGRELSEIREALGDIATALRHLVERYSEGPSQGERS
jgi:hypothetical protein